MNNQAAQTMPELPKAWGFARNVDGQIEIRIGPVCPPNRSGGLATPWAPMFGGDQVQQYAIDYAAALALSRGVPADMVLVPRGLAEPISLDRDLDVLPPWPALPEPWTTASVTYAEDGETCTQSVWTEKQLRAFGKACAQAALDAAAPAAAGAQGEVECSNCNGRGEVGGPVGQTAETFDYVTEPCPECTPQPAAADGGVRERVREFRVRAEMHGSGVVIPAEDIRAIEAALSSHRQAGDVAGLWPSIPSIQRWKMERGSDGHRWSVYMDHCELGEWCKWEEVQQAWFCQALALVEKGAG